MHNKGARNRRKNKPTLFFSNYKGVGVSVFDKDNTGVHQNTYFIITGAYSSSRGSGEVDQAYRFTEGTGTGTTIQVADALSYNKISRSTRTTEA